MFNAPAEDVTPVGIKKTVMSLPDVEKKGQRSNTRVSNLVL